MTNSKTIYQLKITLRDIKPPIWRRVQVQSSTTLSKLHLIIQAAMGWYNCHLHSFSIQGIEYGQPEPDYGFHLLDLNHNQAQFCHQTREVKVFLYL